MRSDGTTGPFRRSDRLLDSRDFQRVLRRGRRRAHADLVVVTLPRGTGAEQGEESYERTNLRPRLGLTTSRKSGNAVARNRFRRRVREWFRANRTLLAPSLDLVVIARRSGTRLSSEELDARLRSLLELEAEVG